MLGSLIGIAIIAVIIFNWDWIADNIVLPIVKCIISLFSLFSMLLLVGVPIAIVVFILFGKRIGDISRNGISWENWGNAIFAVIIGVVVIAVLIFLIKAAFSDEGRLGYIKGVKRNMQRRSTRTYSSSNKPSSSTDRVCRYYSSGICRHPESGGETCPCAGDYYFFTCHFKNNMY